MCTVFDSAYGRKQPFGNEQLPLLVTISLSQAARIAAKDARRQGTYSALAD